MTGASVTSCAAIAVRIDHGNCVIHIKNALPTSAYGNNIERVLAADPSPWRGRGTMHFTDVIATRRSVRAYARRPVEPVQLRAVLDAAVEAPSAGNLQAYRVVIVEAARTRRELADAAQGQGFLADAPVLLVFCADALRNRARYGERGVSLFAVQDATIAAAYVQLAATDRGLSSCWVGAFDEQRVSSLLALPAGELRPVAVLAIGHAVEQPARPPRRSVDEMVRWDAH